MQLKGTESAIVSGPWVKIIFSNYYSRGKESTFILKISFFLFVLNCKASAASTKNPQMINKHLSSYMKTLLSHYTQYFITSWPDNWSRTPGTQLVCIDVVKFKMLCRKIQHKHTTSTDTKTLGWVLLYGSPCWRGALCHSLVLRPSLFSVLCLHVEYLTKCPHSKPGVVF